MNVGCRAGGVVQGVEHLLSKQEALSSNPYTYIYIYTYMYGKGRLRSLWSEDYSSKS
jgi:hypothetical protein